MRTGSNARAPPPPLMTSTRGSGDIVAPLPGRITDVLVAEGDTVTKNQPLMILEAMKMEHTMVAARDGVIDALNVATGDQVAEGALLISIGDA